MNNNTMVLALVLVAGFGAFFAYKAGQDNGTSVVKETVKEVSPEKEGASLNLKINETVDLDGNQ